MKKLVLSGLCILALTACQKQDDTSPSTAGDNAPVATQAQSSEQPTNDSTQPSAQYTVGIDIGSPPFSTRDEQGHATGFEVDILQAIADHQGFSLIFMGDIRTELYVGMETGKYQLMAASLEINPNNEAKFAMTKPHAKSYRAILSRTDKKADSAADFSKGGVVGVQENTISAKVLKEAGIPIKEYPNLLANFRDFVQKKDIDFLVGNAVPLAYYMKQYQETGALNDVHMSPYDNPIKYNNIAFGVAKNNTTLQEQINAGLTKIQEDGTYDTIYKKWFGDDDIAKVTP